MQQSNIAKEMNISHDYLYQKFKEMVTDRKKELYALAAEEYIISHHWKQAIRFDIIAVSKEGNQWIITHFEDAFY